MCQLTQPWSKRVTCLLLEHLSGICCLSCPENAQAIFCHGAASVVAHRRYLGAPRSRKLLTPRPRQAAVHHCLLAQIACVFVVHQDECCQAAEACVHHRTYSTSSTGCCDSVRWRCRTHIPVAMPGRITCTHRKS